ncbi:hypothetical protein [Streptomyces avidinii]
MLTAAAFATHHQPLRLHTALIAVQQVALRRHAGGGESEPFERRDQTTQALLVRLHVSQNIQVGARRRWSPTVLQAVQEHHLPADQRPGIRHLLRKVEQHAPQLHQRAGEQVRLQSYIGQISRHDHTFRGCA